MKNMIYDWGKIAGHSKQIKLLNKFLVNDEMPHALLMVGPSGIGKRTLARRMCKILNCVSIEKKPCEKCHSCKQTTEENLVLLDDEESLKIEKIRLLQSSLQKSNYSRTYQVVLIDKIEKMTLPAANAFLKILEEPKRLTLFVLIASDLSRVIKTIISRSVVIYFDRLSDDELMQYIKENNEPVDAEKIKIMSGRINKWEKIKDVPKEVMIKSVINFWLLLNAGTKFKTNWIFKMVKQDKEKWHNWFYFAETCLRDYLLWKSNLSNKCRWYESEELNDWYQKINFSEEKIVRMIEKTVWFRTNINLGFNKKLQLMDWMM